MEQSLSDAARKENALCQQRGPPPPPSPGKGAFGDFGAASAPAPAAAEDAFGDFGAAPAPAPAPADGFGSFETAGGGSEAVDSVPEQPPAVAEVDTEVDPFADMQAPVENLPVPGLSMGFGGGENSLSESPGPLVALPLAELPGLLMASDWLEEAVLCERHVEASEKLGAEKQRLQQAVADENFEACLEIKKVVAALSPMVQADGVVQEWQLKAQGRGAVRRRAP
jgi:hypothetical protein